MVADVRTEQAFDVLRRAAVPEWLPRSSDKRAQKLRRTGGFPSKTGNTAVDVTNGTTGWGSTCQGGPDAAAAVHRAGNGGAVEPEQRVDLQGCEHLQNGRQ